jgi:hypothetical protein
MNSISLNTAFNNYNFITSSNWATMEDYTSFGNVVVYPNDIKELNTTTVNTLETSTPSWAYYKFANSGSLLSDSSGNNRTLTTSGGTYVALDGKNSIFIGPTNTTTIPSVNWQSFTDLSISGWYRTANSGIVDTILSFSLGTTTSSQIPTTSLETAAIFDASYLTCTTTISAQAYANGVYVMKSSSTYISGTDRRYAAKSFNLTNISSTDGWTSPSSCYNTSTFIYSGTVSTIYNTTQTYNGEWLQIKLPLPAILVSYNLISVLITNSGLRSPRTWIVLGSNDEINWFSVHHQTTAVTWATTGGNESKSYTTSSQNRYMFYRICINSIGGNAGLVSIGEWRLFVAKEIALIKYNNMLSFQINNNPMYEIPYALENKWNHIIFNVSTTNSSSKGFVRINYGNKATFTEPTLQSGTYTNTLGNTRNSANLYISSLRILTTNITEQMEDILYDPTITKLVDNIYVNNAFANINILRDTNNATRLQLNATGVAVTGTLVCNGISRATSDLQLKTIISPIDNALDKIDKITTFIYRYNDIAKLHGISDNRLHIGVSAQDVDLVFPEVIFKSESGILYVSYERLIPVLIACIKELKNEINNIKFSILL